jgi:hypothetical protein
VPRPANASRLVRTQAQVPTNFKVKTSLNSAKVKDKEGNLWFKIQLVKGFSCSKGAVVTDANGNLVFEYKQVRLLCGCSY